MERVMERLLQVFSEGKGSIRPFMAVSGGTPLKILIFNGFLMLCCPIVLKANIFSPLDISGHLLPRETYFSHCEKYFKYRPANHSIKKMIIRIYVIRPTKKYIRVVFKYNRNGYLTYQGVFRGENEQRRLRRPRFQYVKLYYADGYLKKVIKRPGSWQKTYEYDFAHCLKKVTIKESPTSMGRKFKYTYYPDNYRIKKYNVGGGYKSFTWDPKGRLTISTLQGDEGPTKTYLAYSVLTPSTLVCIQKKTFCSYPPPPRIFYEREYRHYTKKHALTKTYIYEKVDRYVLKKRSNSLDAIEFFAKRDFKKLSRREGQWHLKRISGFNYNANGLLQTEEQYRKDKDKYLLVKWRKYSYHFW